MTRTVSAAHAKTHLSELISEVEYKGEKVVIERRGKPVAALVSLNDLRRMEASSVPPRRGLLAAIEEMKKLPPVPDEVIDEMVRLIYEDRRRSIPRVPDLDSQE